MRAFVRIGVRHSSQQINEVFRSIAGLNPIPHFLEAALLNEDVALVIVYSNDEGNQNPTHGMDVTLEIDSKPKS